MKLKQHIIPFLAGFLAFSMAVSSLVKTVPQEVEAATSAELKDQLETMEARKEELNKQLEELKGKLSENSNELEKIVAQKEIIDQEIFTLYQKTDVINEQIGIYGTLIADKQAELLEAQERLAALNEKNKERIRAMEEGGTLSYWSVLFEASSFSDFLDRLNMVQEIASSDKRRLDEMSAAAEEVAQAKTDLEAGQQELKASKTELEQAQATMKVKQQESQDLLAQLIAKGEEYERYIAEKEAEEEDLGGQITDMEQLYSEASYSEWLSTSVPPTTKPIVTAPPTTIPPTTTEPPTEPEDTEPEDTDPPETGGTVGDGTVWKIPTTYVRVSSPFGWRIHPVYGDWRFHNGVDLSASYDTPIVASRSGTVVVAQYSSSAGYYVTIDHGDGFQSKYLHMTHYIVEEGETVTAGQIIGYVGSTGVSTGAHLHFTITKDGEYVNPADYIDF